MKVYEMMKLLADLPSGADVYCSAALTVPELKSGLLLEADKPGKELYAITKKLESVDCDDHNVFISI